MMGDIPSSSLIPVVVDVSIYFQLHLLFNIDSPLTYLLYKREILGAIGKMFLA